MDYFPALSLSRRPMQVILLGIMICMGGFTAAGMRKDLPYSPEPDEEPLVAASLSLAAGEGLQPGGYGQSPALTFIYPLAGIYRIYGSLRFGDRLFGPHPDFKPRLAQHPGGYYLLGRLLSFGYGLLGLGMIFLLGRRVFGPVVGLMAAAWTSCNLLAVSQMQLVNAGSATVFWGLLALACTLRLGENRPWIWPGLCGLIQGVAVTTNYFLVVIILLGWGMIALPWLRPGTDPGRLQAAGRQVLLNLAGVSVVLLVCPALFAVAPSIWSDFKNQLRGSHVGADGLSPAGNLWWYVSTALPAVLSWPQPLLVLVGLGWAMVRGDLRAWGMVLYGVLYFGFVSSSAFHWQHWLLPMVPLFAILAAQGAYILLAYLAGRLHLQTRGHAVLVSGLMMFLLSGPGAAIIRHNVLESSYSTKLAARQWILDHVPAQSSIVQEPYTALLDKTPYRRRYVNTLAQSGESLETYQQSGYTYLMTSDWIWSRYFNDAQRYPREVKFYQQLFKHATLLKEIKPDGRRGADIRIYYLGDLGKERVP